LNVSAVSQLKSSLYTTKLLIIDRWLSIDGYQI